MTLDQWTAATIEDLKVAGFDAREYQGLPLVAMPATHDERVRFLEFQTTLAAERCIYAEGCLFVPAGMRVTGVNLTSRHTHA